LPGFTRQFWLEYFYLHILQAWPSYQNITMLAWAKYSIGTTGVDDVAVDAKTPKQTYFSISGLESND